MKITTSDEIRILQERADQAAAELAAATDAYICEVEQQPSYLMLPIETAVLLFACLHVKGGYRC